jgi:hypothetical protein
VLCCCLVLSSGVLCSEPNRKNQLRIPAVSRPVCMLLPCLVECSVVSGTK